MTRFANSLSAADVVEMPKSQINPSPKQGSCQTQPQEKEPRTRKKSSFRTAAPFLVIIYINPL